VFSGYVLARADLFDPPWSHALARPMANGHYARVKPRSRKNPNRDQIAAEPDTAVNGPPRAVIPPENRSKHPLTRESGFPLAPAPESGFR